MQEYIDDDELQADLDGQMRKLAAYLGAEADEDRWPRRRSGGEIRVDAQQGCHDCARWPAICSPARAAGNVDPVMRLLRPVSLVALARFAVGTYLGLETGMVELVAAYPEVV